jgi:RNA polymerase sigma-70 factor (ECF subfamily)
MNTITSTTLLEGLRQEGSDSAWKVFADRYTPMLLAFSRRLGLDEHDAMDAAQETLIAFAVAYREGRYDRDRGRLRAWLCGIARNKVRELRRRAGRDKLVQDATGQTGFLDQIEGDEGMSRVWEEEWQRAILKACLDRVRAQVEPTTMKAFVLTVLDGRTTEQAAEELGISKDTVFQARSRIFARLRKISDEMETIG